VIDLGGTKVKVLASGQTEVRKADSGATFTPNRLVETVAELAKGWKYEAVSLGYPGRVGPSGPSSEAGNLAPGWVGFDFAAAFKMPVRVLNDAAMQALGSYEGGRMLFLGLGTGLGSTLISQNAIVPSSLAVCGFQERKRWVRSWGAKDSGGSAKKPGARPSPASFTNSWRRSRLSTWCLAAATRKKSATCQQEHDWVTTRPHFVEDSGSGTWRTSRRFRRARSPTVPTPPRRRTGGSCSVQEDGTRSGHADVAAVGVRRASIAGVRASSLVSSRSITSITPRLAG